MFLNRVKNFFKASSDILYFKPKRTFKIGKAEVKDGPVTWQEIYEIKNPIQELVKPGKEKQVGYWFLATAASVFFMITLGGYTRLSKSGLSMTRWKPIGYRYPKSEEQWNEEFENYKKYPEYQIANKDMTVEGFKPIFFVEYFHRLWGNVIGGLFTIPFAYFWARGYLKPKLRNRCLGLLGIGGLQGLIGWWMVKSGMNEKPEYQSRPRVSTYRLFVHLNTAIIIYGALLWNGLNLVRAPQEQLLKDLPMLKDGLSARGKMILIMHFIAFNILTGVTVAGIDAGKVFNTWPDMNGAFESIVQFLKIISEEKEEKPKQTKQEKPKQESPPKQQPTTRSTRGKPAADTSPKDPPKPANQKKEQEEKKAANKKGKKTMEEEDEDFEFDSADMNINLTNKAKGANKKKDTTPEKVPEPKTKAGAKKAEPKRDPSPKPEPRRDPSPKPEPKKVTPPKNEEPQKGGRSTRSAQKGTTLAQPEPSAKDKRKASPKPDIEEEEKVATKNKKAKQEEPPKPILKQEPIKPTQTQTKKNQKKNDMMIDENSRDSGFEHLSKRNQYQVMFSGFDKKDHKVEADKKMLATLGVKIVEDREKNFNVLVMDKFKRTIKFLLALNKGVDIVSYQWVTSCLDKNSALSPSDYIYSDKSAESKYQFKLAQSILKARKRTEGLLTGLKVYIPNNIKPSFEELKDLIESADGTVQKTKPPQPKDDILIVLNEDDTDKAEAFKGQKFLPYTTELIFSAILNQELDLSKNRL